MKTKFDDQTIMKMTSHDQPREAAPERIGKGEHFEHLLTFTPENRLAAFCELITKVKLSPQEYWPLLAFVWRSTSVFYPNRDKWVELLTAPIPNRELMMDSWEREQLASFPDEFPILRGYSWIERKMGISWTRTIGLSWTLDHQIADRYYPNGERPRIPEGPGSYKSDSPVIFTGLTEAQCRRSDVIAYFNDREEHEIIIIPHLTWECY